MHLLRLPLLLVSLTAAAANAGTLKALFVICDAFLAKVNAAGTISTFAGGVAGGRTGRA